MRAVSRARARTLATIARLLVPAALALAVIAYLTIEGRRIDDELHLIAPDALQPGDPVPVRAHWFAGIQRTQGPELVAADVQVQLYDAQGTLAGTVRLTPSHGGSLAGMLVPRSPVTGRASLRAVATHRDRRIELQRPIRFAREPSVPQPLAAQRPDAEATDTRVRSGACTPEHPCELLLRAGAGATQLRLAGNASVDAPDTAMTLPRSRIVAATVVTHGPRAKLDIIATRVDGSETRQTVRLPLALGSARIAPIAPVLQAPAKPTITRVDERGGCVVDAYATERWVRTGALRDCTRGDPVPFAPLPAGLWRVQVRGDIFASDSAALRSTYVRSTTQTDAQALRAIADAVASAQPTDAFAREVRTAPDAYVAERDRVAAYLLAALEREVYAQPSAISSLPAARDALARERSRVRIFALLTLALAGLTLVLLVAQRGLGAAAETRRSLHEAGAESIPPAARQRLRVLGVTTSLLLIFAAIAVYLIARGSAP
jgi:hypothetical protein